MPSLPSRFCATLLLFGLATTAAAASLSPVGTWKTIDDASNKPKSLVGITEKCGGHGSLDSHRGGIS